MCRLLPILVLVCACQPEEPPAPPEWECVLAPGEDPDWLPSIGCEDDWLAVAVRPQDASIPGAMTAKTGVDRSDDDALFFQDTVTYPLHWDFASVHRSGGGLPPVPDLATFNSREYYAPDRRFVLGAVTYYEGPAAWTYEIAPYDTASADLVALAFRAIRDHAYFGQEMRFHPTSSNVARLVPDLPDDVPVVTTDELFAGIDYQPLNLGTTTGRLVFREAETLEQSGVNYRDLVVLDVAPIDLSVCAGVITQEFQTPLSHINVLSRNRGTPNMGLRGAMTNETLRALEDKWVELRVEPTQWAIEEITAAEAAQWWEEHRPDPLAVSPMDTSVVDMVDAEDLLDLDTLDLGAALDAVVPWAGGKAAHMGGLALIGDEVISPDAFVIPMHWYDAHMQASGQWDAVEDLLADPDVQADPVLREERLDAVMAAVSAAPVDAAFMDLLVGKLVADYGPDRRVRLRSSTNSEDLGQFTGAGLYTSQSAVSDDMADVEDALRTVWASMWSFRAFEERAYWGIDHLQVGMAILVHPSFPDEEANGVAVTNNPFDPSGLEPALYVNAQVGETSVVQPPPGVFADQYLHYVDHPGAPVAYLGHSSLVPEGETVLTEEEVQALGSALRAVHSYFVPAYGAGGGWYAMDIEWKVERTGEQFEIWIKQARPYPWAGTGAR